MTTTKNNEHKKLNFSSEREQSQVCLNSAEYEKNQGRKVLNVPNLRFPEFQGEWINCTIGEIGTIKNGPFGSVLHAEDYVDEGMPIVTTEHFKSGCLPFSKDGIPQVSEDDYKRLRGYKLEKDDIVFSRVGSVDINAHVGALQDGWLFSGRVLRVRPIKTINAECLHYVLSTELVKRNIRNRAVGQTMPSINTPILANTKIFLPQSIVEQKKIATLLRLIDERIATQNKIIDKLQSLIKGIVDCTILRKEKNAIVGDVCSISEQIRAEANIDDIITVRLHGNGVCKSSAENLQLGATQYYRRRAGQLIYGKQNFHNGAIGIVPISLDNGITSKDIPSFDIDETKCNSVYLLAQLQSPQYYKPAEALTTGTGSKRLKEETFLKMPIVLPNKREQDNIAVLIHRASMNLDHAKRLLELLSIQKQFLLRQMFI